MDVTVAVATFGDPEWTQLAHDRAIPSAEPQAPVVHAHAGTLAQARNDALAQVTTEHVVFLDADDELEAGYIETLAAGTCDLRAPAVRYLRGGCAHDPYIPKVAGHHHECTADCLPHGNWLIVGTWAPAQLIRQVGGWREFEWSEDWDMWLRCWRAGATIEAVPGAVYRAHVRPDSRNRAPDRALKLRVHQEIHRANFPELYEETAA